MHIYVYILLCGLKRIRNKDTSSTHSFGSNTILQWEAGILGETADYTGNIQDEPGASYNTRKYESAKNTYQYIHNDGACQKETRAKRSRFGTSGQNGSEGDMAHLFTQPHQNYS